MKDTVVLSEQTAKHYHLFTVIQFLKECLQYREIASVQNATKNNILRTDICVNIVGEPLIHIKRLVRLENRGYTVLSAGLIN